MVTIQRWIDLPGRATAETAITQIFFQSSATQTFADHRTRDAFRQRWLGRYLTHDANHVWVATSPDHAIVGYLIGSIDDPAQVDRFSDITFFSAFAELTKVFPAHLHVNLTADARGQRIGEALVERFVQDVRSAGLPGVHVVTGATARNVGFYNRLGFIERGTLPTPGGAIVFLGRTIDG
jgi:ribosomal protein S18 acetylase RimI-like enzyme